ncbi:MAG: hypothetical protein M9921_05135 [Fimbriimonadaceae bacterium]|nr:hypothetical protein [Fimbriimonadaceae bacterium]
MEEPIHFSGWRDRAAELALKDTVLDLIPRRDRSRRLRVLALGLGGSSLALGALSLFVFFGSSKVTLAQVIAADQKADSLTIVHRRIMSPEKGGGFTVTTWVLGDQTRTELQRALDPEPTGDFYCTHGEETIWYRSALNLVVYDAKSKIQPRANRAPRVEEMLKDFAAAKVEEGYNWNGRTVTRFTYKADVGNTNVDEELLVDPETKLPIRFTSMRDRGSWGDEWTYNYAKFDPARLKPNVPASAQVIDHRKLREPMARIAKDAKGAVAMVVIAPFEVAVLMEAARVQKAPFGIFEIALTAKDGSTKMYKGQFADPLGSGLLRVGGRDFAVIRSSRNDPHWEEHWFGKNVAGHVRFNGETYAFADVPTVAAGGIFMLNEPFSAAYWAAHPNKNK